MKNKEWLLFILGSCYKRRFIPIKVFILLAVLSSQGCASQGKAVLIDDEMQTVVVETLQYYLYFPEGYTPKTDEKYPLLLFLHGGGESGDSLVTVKRNGPPKLITQGKKFPFLLLAPQNPYKNSWWNTRAVKQLLDSVVTNNAVDPNRIYLTGLSRGGGAAWELAVQYPDTFAALAVVCAMAPVPYAAWINRKMPIWVFHGTEDKSIAVTESDLMVAKLQEMGQDVQYTRYEGVGHNSWKQAYDTEALYEWLVDQKKE